MRGLRESHGTFQSVCVGCARSLEEDAYIELTLVYSDLVTSGNSRNIEAAERLLEDDLSDFK